MLQLELKDMEFFNESTSTFLYFKGGILKLEHSLISISKWESKWEKRLIPNLNKLSNRELLDYIRCMTIGNVDPELYYCITNQDLAKIRSYMNSKQSATTVSHGEKHSNNHEEVSAELIYYWLTLYNIPFDCDKWHINRLMSLIDVCATKQSASIGKEKKTPKADIYKRNAAINARNRERFHSKG